MKVLVTGITGYLGSYFLQQLRNADGIEIVAIVRETTDITKIKFNNIKIKRCDLKNKKKLKECLKDLKMIDVIFHLAAGLSGSYYELMMDSVIATDNLFKALHKSRIKKFVFVSSFSVYKMDYLPKNGILNENTKIEDQINLRDSYAATKVQQERVVKKYCIEKNIKLSIIRPGKIYGPGTDLIPPQFGIKIPGVCFIMMGGRHLLPIVHVANCANAIWRAGINEVKENVSVYNIVDSNLLTQNEFYGIYKKYLGKIKRLIKLPDFLFKILVYILEVISEISKENIPPVLTMYRYDNLWKPLRYDNKLATEKLNWKSEIDVINGLATTFQHESNSNF